MKNDTTAIRGSVTNTGWHQITPLAATAMPERASAPGSNVPMRLELPVPPPPDKPEKPPEPEDEPVLPPDRDPRPVKDPPRRRDMPEPPEIEEPDRPKPKRRAKALL